MNNVQVIGNLTKDPEAHYNPDGVPTVKLRIAINRGEKADYVTVVVFGSDKSTKLADSCAQYLKKGHRVGVSGSLRYSEWKAAEGGGTRSTLEIVANSVDFLTPRPQGGNEPSGEDQD